ncbi:uncharacterized protein LOC129720015 [Wyeomyia smithii]|uniref:uncharacterized protein LOC129720015 n=1 Tax=Wyeomyia smithii TaxID=174621 RepID=UPI002467F9B7|nr:uncharacterized protein LOC129720015 [Wyeomyia smithii]
MLQEKKPENLEEEAEQHFVENTSKDEEGRFVVKIPFRTDHQQLGNSFEQARKRFLNLEKRLATSEQKQNEYKKFMEEYEAMRHMVPIPAEDLHKVKYFFPHGVVEKPDSTSTLRVVYDANAAKTSGISLSDIQLTGPNVQRELMDILIDFRGHNVVLMADIAKMYRQVKVVEEDTWFQCILYRQNPRQPIRLYRLTTVTYGEAASSFLACRALAEVTREEKEDIPMVAEAISNCFYLDNLMLGAPTVSELKHLKESVTIALEKRCFPLRKWATNDPAVVEDIKPEDLETTLNIGDEDIIKTLGIAWNPKTDSFNSATIKMEETAKKISKRELASKILKLFDPMGFI